MDKLRVMKVNKPAKLAHHCPSWPPELIQSPRNIYYTKQINRYAGDFRNIHQQYSVARPDPSAPHLKYGLFSNKKLASNSTRHRHVSQQSGYIVSQPHTNSDVTKCINQKKIGKQNITKTIRSGVMTKAPTFIYPSSQRQLEHHLSLSQIKHLDIKPRYSCHPQPVFNPPIPFQLISDINVV